MPLNKNGFGVNPGIGEITNGGFGAVPSTLVGVNGATVIAPLTGYADPYGLTLDPANGSIIVQQSGKYLFLVSASYSTSAGSALITAEIYINGSPVATVTPGFQRSISIQSAFGSSPASALLTVAAGDVVDVRVASTSSTDMDFSYFSFIMIGMGNPLAPALGDLLAYCRLLGRSGGQIIFGGTLANNNLALRSTVHGTKGQIEIGELIIVHEANGLVNIGDFAYFDATNMRFGINIDTPEWEIHTVKEDDFLLWLAETYSGINANHDSRINLKRGRGSKASPAAVLNGDRIGSADFSGYYDSSNSYTGIKFGALANENWDVSNRGSKFVIDGVNIGTAARTTWLEIAGAALVKMPGVYSNTTASAANVNVDSSGNLKLSTSSARYKKDIRALGFNPVSVLDVELKTFESLPDNNRTFWGAIAEQVDDVCPELVGYKPIFDSVGIEHLEPGYNVDYSGDGKLEAILSDILDADGDPIITGWMEYPKTGEEPDWIDYAKFGLLLVPIVKELKSRVKTLENQNQAQQDLINDLSLRLEAVKQQEEEMDKLKSDYTALETRLDAAGI